MTHSDPDHGTWLRFISGDPDAFSDLYDQFADVLYAFGMRYSTDRDLVKDCIHDLFIDLHGYRKNLAQDANVKFYLLKSLRRKLHLAHRKSSMLRFDRWDTEDSLAINAFTFSIEDELILSEKEREILQHLAAEINLLPDRQREILYLRFHQDLDYDEIAAIMQISVPTCRTFVYRALKELRGKLEFGAIFLIMCC